MSIVSPLPVNEGARADAAPADAPARPSCDAALAAAAIGPIRSAHHPIDPDA